MGHGSSTGGGAFLPELSDAVIDVLASSYPNAPLDASAMWNDFHGAVTRVPIEATAFPLRRRGFDLFICDVANASSALTIFRPSSQRTPPARSPL